MPLWADEQRHEHEKGAGRRRTRILSSSRSEPCGTTHPWVPAHARTRYVHLSHYPPQGGGSATGPRPAVVAEPTSHRANGVAAAAAVLAVATSMRRVSILDLAGADSLRWYKGARMCPPGAHAARRPHSSPTSRRRCSRSPFHHIYPYLRYGRRRTPVPVPVLCGAERWARARVSRAVAHRGVRSIGAGMDSMARCCGSGR